MDAGWAWILDTYAARTGDTSFEYFGPVAVWFSQLVPYCFFGVLFTLLDVFRRPAFLYRLKVQPRYQFEPGGGSRNPSLPRILGRVAVAFAAELVALVVFQKLTKSVFGTGVKTVYTAPSWFEIGFAIVGLTLLSEVGFYATHRLLHEVPFLYRTVHKYHHEFHTPVALAAEAMHPFEMVLCTAFGMTFWPFLLHTHAQVLMIGTVIGTFSSMSDHSGFWLMGQRHPAHVSRLAPRVYQWQLWLSGVDGRHFRNRLQMEAAEPATQRSDIVGGKK